jgi:glycosyltransferase involved in cell wall biosynthesis
MRRLSICIPTYKRPAEIEECLNSLLKFKDQNFQVIIGDDNSPDHTHEVVEKFRHKFKYFKSIKQESNIGFARNMDSIIRNSSREFIFVLNDDDFAIEQGVMNCINILSSNIKFSAVGARYIPTQNPDQSIEIDYSNAVATIYPKISGAKHLIENLSLCDCHPVMRRSSFEDGCHYYDRTGMLIPIYFELIKRGDVAFIDKPIYQHRTTEISLTTRMSESWFIDMANTDLEICFSDSALGLDKQDLEKFRKNLLLLIYFQAARMALLQEKYYTFWLFIKRYSSLENLEPDFGSLVDKNFLHKILVSRISQIIVDSNFKKVLLIDGNRDIENIILEINSFTKNAIVSDANTVESCDAAIINNRLERNAMPDHLPIIDISAIANSIKVSNDPFVLNNESLHNVTKNSFSDLSHTLFSQLTADYFPKRK